MQRLLLIAVFAADWHMASAAILYDTLRGSFVIRGGNALGGSLSFRTERGIRNFDLQVIDDFRVSDPISLTAITIRGLRYHDQLATTAYLRIFAGSTSCHGQLVARA